MDLGLKGKVALVLGAGGGLGSRIAATLTQEGARVVLADVDQAALDRVAQSLRAQGADILTLQWDLGDLAAIDARVSAIESKFGSVDILVNNTGGPPPTLISGQELSLWSKHFESMVLSVIGITDRVLPGMRKKGWGRVITSTSSGVVAPIANLGLSNALRASLLGWSKTLAREEGPAGITVNVILPGRIATDRIRFLDQSKAKRENRAAEDVTKESTASIPLGRYGEPQEYANVVTFLASVAASYVTGTVQRVDGGLLANI